MNELADSVVHLFLCGPRQPIVTFNTGDDVLDELLERARTQFLSPNPAIRRQSLEALWDAWERITSLELPADKRESTKRLLDKGSGEPNSRQMLEDEARTLTAVGSGFMIRHAEVGQRLSSELGVGIRAVRSRQRLAFEGGMRRSNCLPLWQYS
jgi:hypothetical protein